MTGILVNNDFVHLSKNLTLDKEYKILGIELWGYYIIDDLNNFITVGNDVFKLQDERMLDFWIKDPENQSRIVPQEWLYKNFLFLNEGLEDFIHEEIWIKTQLLRGLINYNLDSIPNNLKFADCDYTKTAIVHSILKTIEVFSNQYRTNGSPYLQCNFIKFHYSDVTIPSGVLKEAEFSDLLMEDDNSFFEKIEYILDRILEYPKIIKQNDDRKSILKRLVYTIWSIFQTDNVKIIMRKYRHYYPEYILISHNKCYKLTIYLDY